MALCHLEAKDTYVRMLFINYSSAFNTVIPFRFTGKLLTLGQSPSFCNWVQNFLTDRSQKVRVGHQTSSTKTVNTGCPLGGVLSPLQYTPLIHDIVAFQSNTRIIKFTTTMMGLITAGDEIAYRREVANLAVRWLKQSR